jgi:hypothetical protein
MSPKPKWLKKAMALYSFRHKMLKIFAQLLFNKHLLGIKNNFEKIFLIIKKPAYYIMLIFYENSISHYIQIGER